VETSSLSDLEKYLKSAGIWYRFIRKPETIHTRDAARVSDLDLHRVTKNLVAVTENGENVLLIVPGDRRVDLRRAAALLGIKNVKLVPFEEAEKISGYPPGATPSIGHKETLRTVLDQELLQFETFFCGGGTREKLVELRVDEVLRISEAIVGEISK